MACINRSWIYFLLVAWALGCSSRSTHQNIPPTSVNPERSSSAIIDAHVHTFFDGSLDPFSKIPQREEEFLRQMKEAGVTGAVSYTLDKDWGYFQNLAQDKNVVFCAGIQEKIDLIKLEKNLKSQKYGCIKIYLGYVHYYASDRRYHPVYKLAQKYNVPVTFHTGDTMYPTAKLKYADPLTIDEVAVDYPKVTFVIAHAGNPWIESAAEVAYKNPNVYVEGSAFLTGDLGAMPFDKIEFSIVKPLAWIVNYLENPQKLLFGTDWPHVNMAAYLDAFRRAIPKEFWPQVFHDNAVKVFKMKGSRL